VSRQFRALFTDELRDVHRSCSAVMGVKCRRLEWGRREVHTEFCWRNVLENDHLEDYKEMGG
jgi:hypothetical protein